ncbi:primosomal protein N' [Gallibacterium genomosp. 1]|uniref:primosomal protein N' n=1 Tax=Gallibacterium genomosp. 1 TaxID=155515 RepID=UPI0008028450|nr:primosomal protein N' [Gallibacterium genomosp. 1]OBX03229.1 primosomal protein N' [Gallibacterium genomosp. 1]
MKIVRVALDIALRNQFDYLLPDSLEVTIGTRVLVPFGTQKRIGIVSEFLPASEVENLKAVLKVLDQQPLFDEKMWQLLLWAKDYYHYPIGEALFTALPIKFSKEEHPSLTQLQFYQLTESGKAALAENSLKRALKQQEMLRFLLQHQRLEKESDIFSATIKRQLLQKNYVELITDEQPKLWFERAIISAIPLVNEKNKLMLNKEQALAVSQISLRQGFHSWLLQGVTGSGKTEVYLQVIEEVLKQKRQVLVLVPEIGLTPQIIRRFNLRFNVPIGVLHSNMTDNSRLQVWQQAKKGELAIVIGTRSAIFTQFYDLGLIVLDEEHDQSFKQQEGWRYHARDLAVYRAKQHHIPIILGSATPSLESLHNVENRKYHFIPLRYRATNQVANHQMVVDLKTQPMENGLSYALLQQMKQVLERGEQVLLFLNRRGFAPVYLCHECGTVETCPRCNRPYTYHQSRHILQCHHCDAQKTIPFQCKNCGSTHLLTTGIGTEQLEQVLQQKFPQYQIARLDRDNVTKKGELDRYLDEIAQGKRQILIGTQMLAKGHHFPNVGLVGLINIDSALFSSDFRAEERLAQLYVQVAGRTGRGNKAGLVLLQTHYPEHPLFNTLISKGYSAFSQQALLQRQQFQLPPYSYQALLKASGNNETQLSQSLTFFVEQVKNLPQAWLEQLQIVGPLPALMEKRAGKYRWYVLFQHQQRSKLHQVLFHIETLLNTNKSASGVRLSLDIDPYDFS